MAKVFQQLAVLGMLTSVLAGCQSTALKDVKETEHTRSNALIHCSGTENCEFERLDRISIVDAKTHKVSKEATKQGIVRQQKPSLKDPNALYLSVPPGQHELVVRFYPISPDKAETLYVIHQFKPHQRYHLHMFRDRAKNKSSLLNASAPDPLCVDLKQQHRTIRRFCKPYNVLNGLGEFVEKKNFKTR